MIQDIHPHQFNNCFVATSGINNDDYIFHFRENALLLKQNGTSLEIPKKKDITNSTLSGTFLFTLNNISCFLVSDCPTPKSEQFLYHEIKFRNSISEKEIDWASGVALQLRNWYQQNKFCGNCGTPTVAASNERAITCPSCQTTLFPSISPAIIVAIIAGDKILLARNAHFPEAYYSLIAGYTDIGESIEDTIIREVHEEVGLDIKNIRYYKSQPWPFSGSMMIGFIAEGDDTQTIQIDNKEIVEAAWFSRNNLPNHPPNRSIAGELIEKFKNNTL